MNEPDKFEPKSLEEAVRICVVPIDEHLGELGVPIPDRVLKAAFLFLEHNVREIEGASKEDFFNSAWFQAIYRTVRSWYEEKYGAALKTPEANLTGACEIAGAFFEIRVPITLRRVEKPGETFWLVFPIDLQPEEDVARWFVVPPNFEALEPTLRDAALESATSGGRLLRTIHSDLMTAERPDDNAVGLAEKIQPHIETAAKHLTQPRKPVLGLAVWDSHQAVETALKLLSRQLNGSHAPDHELVRLFRKVSTSLGSLNEEAFAILPSKRRVLEVRAGEGAPVDPATAYAIYRTSLELTAKITTAMPRKVRMNNGQLLLRRPPFI